jgi:hypothetical protein
MKKLITICVVAKKMKTNRQQLNTVLTTMTTLVLLAVGPTQSAWADVTYTYDGNPFSYVGTGPDVTNVSGSFTVASFLPANTTLTLTPYTVGGTITSLDFTDGRSIWGIDDYVTHSDQAGSNPVGIDSLFSVTTDATGEIVSWYFNILSTTGLINSWNSPSWDSPISGYVVGDGSQQWYNYNAGNLNAPGTWTVSGIPEPATIILLTLGGLVLRKKN